MGLCSAVPPELGGISKANSSLLTWSIDAWVKTLRILWALWAEASAPRLKAVGGKSGIRNRKWAPWASSTNETCPSRRQDQPLLADALLFHGNSDRYRDRLLSRGVACGSLPCQLLEEAGEYSTRCPQLSRNKPSNKARQH